MSRPVVIEGGEGSGKSTLIHALKRLHPNWEYTREPGGTPFAEQVRMLLFSRAELSAESQLMLFFAARMEHLFLRIRPALKEGRTVVSDRFDASSYAYQVHGANRPDLEHLFWELRSIVLGDIELICIYLDIEVELGMKRVSCRGESNHFDEKSLAFHKRVRAAFQKFMSSATLLSAPRYTINASGPREEILGKVLEILRDEHVISL